MVDLTDLMSDQVRQGILVDFTDLTSDQVRQGDIFNRRLGSLDVCVFEGMQLSVCVCR